MADDEADACSPTRGRPTGDATGAPDGRFRPRVRPACRRGRGCRRLHVLAAATLGPGRGRGRARRPTRSGASSTSVRWYWSGRSSCARSYAGRRRAVGRASPLGTGLVVLGEAVRTLFVTSGQVAFLHGADALRIAAYLVLVVQLRHDRPAPEVRGRAARRCSTARSSGARCSPRVGRCSPTRRRCRVRPRRRAGCVGAARPLFAIVLCAVRRAPAVPPRARVEVAVLRRRPARGRRPLRRRRA